MQAYQEAIDKLYELQKFGIKLGLNSTENLLQRLGDPHKELNFVHLAGTNGKGSVGAMLEAALLRTPVRVGFYTSPHLARFTERFRLGGEEISRERVLDLIEKVWAVTDPAEPPTFFEFVTAMAFLYYAEEKADCVLLETGLGGRLDATNVCSPLVSVITNIGLEHQEFLGNTLEAIAFEKAGIIKVKTPVVHGVRQPSARKVIEDRAQELEAPIIRRGRELTFRRDRNGGFGLRGRKWAMKQLSTNLVGRHQASNACLALGALEVISDAGLPVGPGDLHQGLTKVHWPGRLEMLTDDGQGPRLWLDGAHNLPAARALIENLDIVRQGRSPLVMVVGVMADKEIAKILDVLVPGADYVVYSRPAYDRAADPGVLAEKGPSEAPHEVIGDLSRALMRASSIAGQGGVVLVTGSLFTVGEARAILTGEVITDLP